MTILVLTSSFPRHKSDWWARFVLNIYKALDNRKFNICLLAPHSPGAKKNEKMNGVYVERFAYFYPYSLQMLTSGVGILYAARKNLLGKLQIITFIVAEILAALSILVRKKIDIIHAHWILPQGFVAVIAKFIYGKPVIVTAHGSDIFGLKSFNFIKKIVLKHCDVCTVNSKSTFDAVRKLSPKTHIKLIPMGVDLQMFNEKKRDGDWRKKFGENPNIILGVGRLIKWKGFEYLIESFPRVLSRFPNAKLIIVGTGPEEQSLRRRAKELNLEINKNLFFLGNILHDKLSRIYASSDVFVSPSITYFQTGEKEGQGLVILEALACGLPVVASRSGGIVDLIDGKSTGLLFEEKNSKEMAKKIIDVLSEDLLRKGLSENGIKLVKKKYSWEKISREFAKLYKQHEKI